MGRAHGEFLSLVLQRIREPPPERLATDLPSCLESCVYLSVNSEGVESWPRYDYEIHMHHTSHGESYVRRRTAISVSYTMTCMSIQQK